jgi:hypothetical protein
MYKYAMHGIGMSTQKEGDYTLDTDDISRYSVSVIGQCINIQRPENEPDRRK